MKIKTGDYVRAIPEEVKQCAEYEHEYAPLVHGQVTEIFGPEELAVVRLDGPTLALNSDEQIQQSEEAGEDIFHYHFSLAHLEHAPKRGFDAAPAQQVERVMKLTANHIDQLAQKIHEVNKQIAAIYQELTLKAAQDSGYATTADERHRLADSCVFFHDVMVNYHGSGDPGEWRPDEVAEILDYYIPAKYYAETEDIEWLARDIVFSLRALQKEGGLSYWNGSDFKRITKLADQTAKKASNPDNWGMSRSLIAGMHGDGIDFTDQKQIDRWITAFNNRPSLERDAIFNRPAPAKPVRTGKKYGRNDRVTVLYDDGQRRENVKYKTVLQDLERGYCRIV